MSRLRDITSSVIALLLTTVIARAHRGDLYSIAPNGLPVEILSEAGGDKAFVRFYPFIKQQFPVDNHPYILCRSDHFLTDQNFKTQYFGRIYREGIFGIGCLNDVAREGVIVVIVCPCPRFIHERPGIDLMLPWGRR